MPRISACAVLTTTSVSPQVGSLEALLRAGADREARAGDGNTPLLLAVYEGQAAAVEALLGAGADKEAKVCGCGGGGIKYQPKLNRTQCKRAMGERHGVAVVG